MPLQKDAIVRDKVGRWSHAVLRMIHHTIIIGRMMMIRRIGEDGHASMMIRRR